MLMKPIYIGDIDLTYDTLEHYGVKGMKWGKRKAKFTKLVRKVLKRKPTDITDYYGLKKIGTSSNKIGPNRSGSNYGVGLWAGRNRANYNYYHNNNAIKSKSKTKVLDRLQTGNEHWESGRSFQNKARTASERAAATAMGFNIAYKPFNETYKVDTKTNKVKRYKKKKTAMGNDPRYRK